VRVASRTRTSRCRSGGSRLAVLAPGGCAHGASGGRCQRRRVALDGVAGGLPVGQSAWMAPDVAVAVGIEGVGGGGGVDAMVVVGVEDDLVVAVQRGQRRPWAGKAEGSGDVPGSELPRPHHHDQFAVVVGVEGGLEFLSGDELHRWRPFVLAAGRRWVVGQVGLAGRPGSGPMVGPSRGGSAPPGGSGGDVASGEQGGAGDHGHHSVEGQQQPGRAVGDRGGAALGECVQQLPG
jgi:hypothetical protein